MAKNDWVNNEQGVRAKMNQPLWLASGTADGSGNILLYASPGSIRYPQSVNPKLAETTGTQVNFKAKANENYMIYAASSGALMVSGLNGLSPGVGRPGLPLYNAEPIGYIEVGASIITANITGPWNGVSDNTTPYEQRGQYNAIMTSRQRNVSRQYRSAIDDTKVPAGQINISPRQSYATASGIAWLQFADNAFLGDVRTQLSATVTYVPSGALQTGVLYQTPTFVVWRGEDGNASGGTDIPMGLFPYSIVYGVAQDPHGGVRGGNQVQTASFTILASGTTGQGYALGAYLDNSNGRSDSASAIYITSVDFRATPNIRKDDTSDGS